MSLNLSIPQLDKNSNTKDYVISVLSHDWPLTIKKMYNVIKKKYGYKATYQAVYKTVQELVKDDVITRTEEGYQLNLYWLKRIHDYTEITQSNYYTKSRVNVMEGVKDSKIDGNFQVLTFESWFDVEKYLYYLQKHCVLNSEKKITVVMHHNHEWRPLFYMRAEYNWITNLKDKGHDIVFLCSNSTPTDIWATNFYKKMGVKAKTGARCAETSDLLVFGDMVIQIFIPPELSSNLNNSFSKAKSVSDIDVPLLINKVFEKKVDIKVVINKDLKLAKQIISNTLSKF